MPWVFSQVNGFGEEPCSPSALAMILAGLPGFRPNMRGLARCRGNGRYRHDRAAPRGIARCRSPCRETMSENLHRSSRVPRLAGLDAPRWRPGITVTDGMTDARLRG
jgi:hypothetical protein